jgi:hypothetical protein
MQINRLIERFLREQDLPPTKFGRLVIDMRNGRQIRDDTRRRIEDFMQAYRRAHK